MKKYIPCQICKCKDCLKGTYRINSWFCPILKKQICDICCHFDMDAIEYKKIRKQCIKTNCKHYAEL